MNYPDGMPLIDASTNPQSFQAGGYFTFFDDKIMVVMSRKVMGPSPATREPVRILVVRATNRLAFRIVRKSLSSLCNKNVTEL